MKHTWLAVIIALAAVSVQTVATAQTAVGSVPGSFNVTLAGSATYSIPLRIAPGTAGVQPQIALVYDSQASSGPLGAGWAISGLSRITRGPKNARFDGVPDGVRMQDSDALYLDGQRLVATEATGSGATRKIEYRKELDDQTRIIETGADFGSAKFVAQTNAGLTIIFDSSAGAPSDQNRGDIKFSDGSVLLRAETRILDASGNFIDFYYLVNGNGNYDIKTIRYTGHAGTPAEQTPYASIDFNYETAPRATQAFVAGRSLSIGTRLTGIACRVASRPEDVANSNWVQVSRYSFDYEDRSTANRFVLKAVHQFGEDNSELTPTTFTYSAPTIGWGNATYAFPGIFAVTTHEELAAGYRFAHVNPQNALPDLLYAAINKGQLESFSFQNNGSSWTSLDSFKSPVPFVTSEGLDLGVIVTDITGDGRADLLQSYQLSGQSTITSSYIASANGWKKQAEFDLPFVISRDGKQVTKVELGRWSGGPGPDLLYQAEAANGFLVNTATGWRSDSRYGPPFDLNSPTWIIDVDCSGKPALLGAVKDSAGSISWKIFKFGPEHWDEVTSDMFRLPFSPQVNPDAVRVITVDNTACPAVLVATAEGAGVHAVYQASPNGWQQIPAKTPSFDLVDASGQSAGAVVAKIAGDGLSDVLANRMMPNGQANKFAFVQTATTWLPVPATFAVPVLRNASGQVPTGMYVGDLTGNGRADLVFPQNSRQSFGEVYLATDAGFVQKPDFTPPVAFAKKGSQDLGVRMLDLNGHGLADVLVSRSGDPTPGAWYNTGAGWVAEPGLVPPVAFAGDNISGNPVQFLDVDGDGYIDLLYSYSDAGGTRTKLFRNVTSENGMRKWSDASTDGAGFAGLIPPSSYPFAAEHVGDMGVRFADVTGTGRPYMLVGFLPASSGSSPTLAAFKNDGHNWIPAPEYAPPIPFVAQIGPPNAPSPDTTDPSRDLFVQIVDINGDGLPDIVAKYHDPRNPSTLVEGVWLNTGTGWSKDASIPVPVALDTLRWNPQTQALQWDTNASIQWGDVNGDGIPDILYTRREGASNESTTYLGTGRGWIASASWQIPLDALPDRAGDPGLRVIDVNGDGFPDLLYLRQESDGSITKGLLVNSGAGWLPADKTSVPDIPFVDKDGNDLGVRLYDIDGKGLLDIIQAYSGDSPQSAIKINLAGRSDVVQTIVAGYGMRTDISYQSLISTTLPDLSLSGAALRAELSWGSVYEADHGPLSYPTIAPIPAAYVVRRAVTSESPQRQVAFSYRYGGFEMDALSKSALGFRWRESVDEANGIVDRTVLSQNIDYVGRVQQHTTCWINFAQMPAGPVLQPGVCSETGKNASKWLATISNSQSSWKVKKGQVGGGPLPSLSIRQLSLTSASSSTYELDGHLVESHADTFEYDEPTSASAILDRHLNTLRTVTTWSDGYVVEAVNTYDADDLTRWFLGRVTKTTVTKTLPKLPAASPAPAPETRRVGFSYDPNTGLLSSQTVNLGTLREVTTAYARDIYGNTIQEVTHASGIQDHAPTTFTYDRVGRFLTSTTNALGQKTSQRLSVTSGLTEEAVDLNGVAVFYKYDGLGRIKETDAPTGLNTSIKITSDYLELTALDPSVPVSGVPAAYALRLQTTDGVTTLPYAIRLFDAKGRKLRSITEGFHKDYQTHRYIVRDVSYDLFGQISQMSLPYETGRIPLWATSQRDALGRVTKQTAADGGVVNISYAGSDDGGTITTTVDHRRTRPSTSTVRTNARNLPLIVTNTNGKKLIFDYNAGDKPTTIIDPLGNTTNYKYDDYGNRIAVADPDIGRWAYEYDSLGRLTKQVDTDAGATQVTKVDYDALNRVRQETRPNQVWTWEYDSSDHGVGRVALAKDDANRYTERYSYDEVGRLGGVDISISGKTYTSTQGYDSFGRVIKVGYPDNFAVNNLYDAGGFMVQVADGSTNKALWSLAATDAFGNPTGSSYGNGVTDVNSYDPKTDRPTQFQAVGRTNARIVDLRLIYDLAGDLRRRTESVQRKSEAFDYDDVDRLVSLTRPDGTRDSYSYDAGGRFQTKAGTTFVYGNGAPNRSPGCIQIPLPAHGVVATSDSDGHRSYSYDCHGNMIVNGDQSYTFSSDGRLVKAEHSAGQGQAIQQSEQFDYAPSGARYRELAKHGARLIQTVTVSGYEEITEYGMNNLAATACFVRSRWYVNNGLGTFAVVEKSRQQCNGLIGTIFHDGAQPVRNVPVEISKTWYLHKDQLGSILAITDEKGVVRGQFWYDPWGKRTSHIFDDLGVPSGARLEDSWARGFLGQQHLPDFELIHLNGRVYDPHLGNFVSPDPLNQSPLDTELWNPYSYSRNNPLRYKDANGYWFGSDIWNGITNVVHNVGNAIGSVAQGVGHAFEEAGKWVGQNWKQIVVVAAVVAVTVLTAGTGGPAAASLGTAILSGMAAGATAGGLSAALYGGNLNDVLTGAIKGGVIGAFSGAALYGVGSLTAGGGTLNGVEGVAGHGIVGGARELAYGGNFWQGFQSGAVTKTSSLVVPMFDSGALNVARAAVVGGTVAAIGGGNFANGAVTGGFSYAFNDAMHPPVEDAIYPTSSPIDFAILGIGSLYSEAADFIGGMLADDGMLAVETGEVSVETTETVYASGERTLYENITNRGSVLNVRTDLTPEEFGLNLESSGFIKGTAGEGNVTTYIKGETQYTIYPRSTGPNSGGVPTVQVKISGEVVGKIRLQ